MSRARGQELSVYACVTGLALIACWAALMAMHAAVPRVLPMLIAAVGGFELAMWGIDLWLARGGARR